MQYSRQALPFQEIVIRGAVWALVGMIFSALFTILAELLRDMTSDLAGPVAATIGAAMLTALVYGSMRLTVVVANITFIAMLIYTFHTGPDNATVALIWIGAGIGLVLGAVYGRYDRGSRIFCADAKIVAGAVAGGVGGLLMLLIAAVVGADANWPVLVVAPLAVLSYIALVPWFLDRCRNLLSPMGDGALVGLGVGSITGMLFLIMAGSLDPQLLAPLSLQDEIQRIEQRLPEAIFGCAAICFPIGAIRAIMQRPWYNF